MTENTKYDVVIVGSGPNGLAAAITLARNGFSVLAIEASDSLGGGIRSKALLQPDCIHDICAAVHPLALASPFFRSLPLADYGVEWIHSPIPLAHPMDDGTAVVLKRSIEETADSLGADAKSYCGLTKPIVNHWEDLIAEILQPMHFPRHPILLARFGIRALQSADRLVRSRFNEDRTRALFAGLVSHSIRPFNHRTTAAFGMILGAAAHAVGWPIAKGGSQTIASAMASYLKSLGGEIQTGFEVRSLKDVPPARAIMFDLTPRQLASIEGLNFPPGYRRKLEQHRYGPGVFKMDWILDRPIPWAAPACIRSATVHLGGSYREIADAESQVWQDEHPERPLVILAQPSAFDPSRAPKGKHIVWAYCHVPNGSEFDMSERIEDQIERFAPGFRDSINFRHVMYPADMEMYNPNYVGGDISGGLQDFLSLFVRPLSQWQPYRTSQKGIYICSSSMPPGAGVHGLCGYHAARAALKDMA